MNDILRSSKLRVFGLYVVQSRVDWRGKCRPPKMSSEPAILLSSIVIFFLLDFRLDFCLIHVVGKGVRLFLPASSIMLPTTRTHFGSFKAAYHFSLF